MPIQRSFSKQLLRFFNVAGTFAMVLLTMVSCSGTAVPANAVAPTPTSGSQAAANSANNSTSPSASASGEKIKIGFIALTDSALVIIAQERGFYAKYGLNVEVVKQASWAAVRDNLLNGEIQAAHMLFGLPFSVNTGVGGVAGKEIYIAMVLNNNGQALTLDKEGFGGNVGFRDTEHLKEAVEILKAKKEVTFAMTFPGGTHDMWLRYWLAAAGVDQSGVKIITIPPPQMVANMKVGNMDGYSVGEPWNGIAVKEDIGFTTISSQDIWQHHPEKALGVNAEFANTRREDLKLLMKAILEASQYIERPENIAEVARIIGQPAYVNASADVIDARLKGDYDLGAQLGKHQYTDDAMRFYNDGKVNFPRRGHAVWFIAQYVRFGYLKELPANYQAIADKLILSDLYREVAMDMSIPVPDDDMTPFTVTLDKATFDPANPRAYLKTYGGQ